MEGTQVFVNLKQCLVVPGFRKKGVCIRPAAQQGLVDGEDFCSRLSGPEGKIMLPCMFVITAMARADRQEARLTRVLQ